MPVVHIPMARRDEAAYERVFTAIRNKVMNHCGSLGPLERALLITDWEPAAFNAFTTVFPLTTSKVIFLRCSSQFHPNPRKFQTCAFHFSKDLQRKMDELGLRLIYEKSEPYDAVEYASFHKWVRRIVGLVLLPADSIMHAWDQILRFPPVTGNQVNIRTSINRNYV